MLSGPVSPQRQDEEQHNGLDAPPKTAARPGIQPSLLYTIAHAYNYSGMIYNILPHLRIVHGTAGSQPESANESMSQQRLCRISVKSLHGGFKALALRYGKRYDEKTIT
jgi:hypothetical protein